MDRTLAFAAALALVAALVAPAAAARADGTDTATLKKSREAAGKRMTEATARAKAAAEDVRKAVGDPENRVARDTAEIDAKAANGEYETALGTLGITLDHLPGVPEETRGAAQAGLERLRTELQAAETARRADDALRELEERLAPLDEQVASSADLVSPLKDLDASVAKAELAQALSRAEVAALRGRLAGVRATFAARIAKEMAEKASADLAELEKTMPQLRTAFAGADAAARDSAHSIYSEAAGAIRYSLARVPESDDGAKQLRERLAKLDAERKEAYAKGYGETIHAMLKENFESFAHEFAEWEAEEAAPPTAAEYVNLDGSNLEAMRLPRTAAYVNRANPWLAYAGSNEEYRLAADHPKLKGLMEAISKGRAAALDRLHKAAEALVAEMAKTPIEDERVRNRFMVLADWDLRALLQDDPRQRDLVARLHEVVDAYDRKALGDEKALALVRTGAAEAAEANWTRMTRVPAVSGFDALNSALFKGRLVSLENVHDFGASFKPGGDHDLVLSIDGNLFAARYDPAVKAAIAATLARTKTALGPADELDIIVQVGDEGTLALDAPGARSVAVRKLVVVGIRTGPVAFMAQ